MKTNFLRISAFVCFLTAALFSGCKDEDIETTGVCPVVVSTNPANETAGIPVDKIITVTFNKAMNPSTITPESFTIQERLKSASLESTGSITYDASNYTMSYRPYIKLEANSTYTIQVASTVKDLNGNALQETYVSTFTTGTTLAPVMVAADPAANATGVFLNKRVDATFNMDMNPLSFNATTFTVKQGTTLVAGTVSCNGTTASYVPSNAFAPNTVYTVNITDKASNIQGTTLTIDTTWTFTTGTVTGPAVNSTNPSNMATNVSLDKKIDIIFSGPMDPSKISTSTFKLMLGNVLVPGSVTYVGNTATFTPTGSLLSGKTYMATITTGAQNLAGIPLANNYTWSFSTNSPLGPMVVNLKSVSKFGIIAGVGISNNAGFSEIHNMDVGISPGVRSSITGFPPAIMVNGAIYASDDFAPAGVPAMLLQAKQDLLDAYLYAEAAVLPAPVIVSGNQGGLTLAPGIYKSTSSLSIEGSNLTLDAQGDVNAVWIFQISSTLITTTGGNVILSGGAQAKNVFWQVASSATIGDYTSFKGNVLALSDITMNSGATIEGRMLARNGSVIMTNTNIINKP